MDSDHNDIVGRIEVQAIMDVPLMGRGAWVALDLRADGSVTWREA